MADYCTTADVTAVGRLDITGTDYDPVLGDLITACSRWIDRYCRVPENGFAQAAAAARYYGPERAAGGVLHLDVPLLSVSSLVNARGEALAADLYRLHPRNGGYYSRIALLSTASWAWTADGEAVVTGLWGMAAAAPPVIKEAAAMLTAWTFKRYMAGLQDATANLDLGQLYYSEGIPKQVRFLLQGYRWTVL